MDVQLYTEMYNNLYTPHTNETAGSTAEQAENGDVQKQAAWEAANHETYGEADE